jgi:hypothetical protein
VILGHCELLAHELSVFGEVYFDLEMVLYFYGVYVEVKDFQNRVVYDEAVEKHPIK